LAIFGGRPRKISTGKERREPPPASVFKLPATTPTAKSRRRFRISKFVR